MSLLKKIKGFILPEEVDFFNQLRIQSLHTQKVIDELYTIFIETDQKDGTELAALMNEAKEIRSANLQQLYSAFITPVDKEAICRAYISFDWVILSIKHLSAELQTYSITSLKEYEPIMDLLCQQMTALTEALNQVKSKKFDMFLEKIFEVMHLHNLLIKEYAVEVSALLETHDIKEIIKRKEILTQMKEISKHIRMCANDLEDIIFKMT